MKLAKNQAKAKQHPVAEFLLFENYPLSSSMLSSKNKRRYTKKKQETGACFNEIVWLIITKMRLKMKNRSYRYNINRPRPRHGHKY